MSVKHFQVVVLGSGFAGSLMAMIAHRLGFSTLMIERGRHPRFAIGESSTPLANLLLEEIAVTYDLPFARPLAKWGSWQKQLPQIACGLKRGFTFYHHEFGKPFVDKERHRQLLVGASPREEIADTHWYRPEFDEYLARQAQGLGVEFWDATIIDNAAAESGGMRLRGSRDGPSFEITGEFVIDATGPRGSLVRALGIEEKRFLTMPATQALFSHFRGVGVLPQGFCPPDRTPPYPPEQAAVHHVFPGGWIWVLKLNNGITSAGVAAVETLADDLDFKAGEAAWKRLLARLPSLAEIFKPAQAIIPFVRSPRLSFRAAQAAGMNWALLPSAAAFVDPLLSTGFPLTLLGVLRIADLLKAHWGRASFASQLEEYSHLTLLEADATARLVGALYATMDRFDLFRELTMLYFAAASYSETARRLAKPYLANSFLLSRHPVFATQLHEICQLAPAARLDEEIAGMRQRIHEAIEPFDVAGLTDRSRHPWYPALASDMVGGARKLDASESEVIAVLKKCGLDFDATSTGRKSGFGDAGPRQR